MHTQRHTNNDVTYRQQLQQHYGTREGQALYRHILEEVFQLSQTDILLGKDSKLSPQHQQQLRQIVARLLKNEPIQQILGYATFCGRRYNVTPHTLIPRPETEQLVRELLRRTPTPRHILDIGTGTGCIAITLAHHHHHLTAIDISPQAIATARTNAAAHHADIHFIQADILHPTQPLPHADIIISNPPYVLQSEAAHMHPNVLHYEPHLALFVPDSDPLIYYRAIALQGHHILTPQGQLYLEINHTLAHQTAELLAHHHYHDITIIKDQYDKDRIITAHL